MIIRDKDFSLLLFHTCGLIYIFPVPISALFILKLFYSTNTALILTKIFKRLQIVLDPSVSVPSCLSSGICMWLVHFMMKNVFFKLLGKVTKEAPLNISNKDKRGIFPENERK